MTALDVLATFFPTGTAEGEHHILDKVFILPRQLADVLSAPPGSPRLMVGNKGIGKTAVLDHLQRQSIAQGVPALLLRPDDLEVGELKPAGDVGTIKRQLNRCLVSAIATRIGRDLSGFLKGDKATLYEEAVRSGKKKDLIGRIRDVLCVVAKPIVDIDGDALARAFGSQTAADSLAVAVRNQLMATASVMIVAIDDTDQIASPDDPTQFNRIWGLLLAARKITQECPELRFIVSLRSEVWARLQRDEHGQRDQVDHFRPLVVGLRADDDYLWRIFLRRVEAAGQLLGGGRGTPSKTGAGGTSDVLMSPFFDSDVMRLPTSTDERTWRAFLLKSARERPRDLVRLVALMIAAAKSSGHALMTSDDAEGAMHEYSRERVDDLAVETAGDCSVMRDVVRTFATLNFKLDFETLREHLKRVPSGFSLMVRGHVIRPNDDDDALLLLSALHEAGFINPWVPDRREPRNFRHVNFRDDPLLVQRSRWNELQAATWEVHPAFRTFLQGVRRDREARSTR